LFPEARIFSFEPLPGPAARFHAVFAGDAQVKLYEAAIGPVRGETTIHISKRDDSSSLLPITAKQDALFPGTAEIGTTTVSVGPLHDFVSEDRIGPPALLKLDVQGFELQALQGCESLLHRFAYVYAECSFVELYGNQALADEVIAWLRERGFRLHGVYNMTYDDADRAVQADFLFAASAG
jgi:FkbM family methyltransferase